MKWIKSVKWLSVLIYHNSLAIAYLYSMPNIYNQRVSAVPIIGSCIIKAYIRSMGVTLYFDHNNKKSCPSEYQKQNRRCWQQQAIRVNPAYPTGLGSGSTLRSQQSLFWLVVIAQSNSLQYARMKMLTKIILSVSFPPLSHFIFIRLLSLNSTILTTDPAVCVHGARKSQPSKWQCLSLGYSHFLRINLSETSSNFTTLGNSSIPCKSRRSTMTSKPSKVDRYTAWPPMKTTRAYE